MYYICDLIKINKGDQINQPCVYENLLLEKERFDENRDEMRFF